MGMCVWVWVAVNSNFASLYIRVLSPKEEPSGRLEQAKKKNAGNLYNLFSN